MEKKENLHSGHRQRLKNRVVAMGIKNMPDHEVLELILGYCIPYRDTNALAHRLLGKYQTMFNLFNQSIESLRSNDGVSDHTAILLNSMPKILEKYIAGASEKSVTLSCIIDTVNYFRNNYLVGDTEAFFIVCLTAKGELIRTIELSSKSAIEVNVELKDSMQALLASKAAKVLLIHTHPKGECIPSRADDNATLLFLNLCTLISIKVEDHVIFNHNDYYAYSTHGRLSLLLDKLNIGLGTVMENNTASRRAAKLCQDVDDFNEN